MGKKIYGSLNKAMKMLEAYSWPGNVRELQNIMERSVIKTKGSKRSLAVNLEEHDQEPFFCMGVSLKTLPEMERDYIVAVLQKSQ